MNSTLVKTPSPLRTKRSERGTFTSTVRKGGRVRLKTTRTTLITGGAGFVGCNLANHLLSQGEHVIVYDNLSRRGVNHNFSWLRKQFGDRVTLVVADVRDLASLSEVVTRADAVYHLAAQVAVTSSLANPIQDFEVNVRGTLNLLESIRKLRKPPSLVFTSTNKVYGGLSDVTLQEGKSRFIPLDLTIRKCGIPLRQLAFHSPYGCSKGAADQYVLDYARTFSLPATVFRMSCIYGPHQFGNEDQGWIAHFLVQSLRKKAITIYGDGRQVRDVLYVDDLVRALIGAREHIESLQGTAYNVGGGPGLTTSLIEVLDIIEQVHGSRPQVKFSSWRAADQRYYVSDNRQLEKALNWSPTTDISTGVANLHRWLVEAGVAKGSLKPEAVI